MLVIGDAVLGAEVRAGTFQFTWLSPAPTWQIVLGRWVGGSLIALVTIVPATALAAVVAGDAGRRRRGGRRGRRSRALAYVAIFIAIGCITRRTAVWSLAFVFLVERLLGAALTGIAQISPTWESRSIFVSYIDNPPSRLVRTGIPSGAGASRAAADRRRDRVAARELADAAHAVVRRLRLSHSAPNRIAIDTCRGR